MVSVSSDFLFFYCSVMIIPCKHKNVNSEWKQRKINFYGNWDFQCKKTFCTPAFLVLGKGLFLFADSLYRIDTDCFLGKAML